MIQVEPTDEAVIRRCQEEQQDEWGRHDTREKIHGLIAGFRQTNPGITDESLTLTVRMFEPS